ncbi:MAG TPA: hypothetical protein VK009_29045 [Chloroflexota bacterium]|nr:hypothetical protein [Chloroflexota bacterium]
MEPEHAGRWLLARFLPCSLFSLKLSFATSSVGKTSLIPTPYAIKMALVDAAFRLGDSEAEANELMHRLREIEVRISPPKRSVVTNTFIKVRQEPKGPTAEEPYISGIAYREFAWHAGVWTWAFHIRREGDDCVQQLERLLPHISYIGKRGSLIQFVGLEHTPALDDSFSQPLKQDQSWTLAGNAQLLMLDDFGPEADLEVLNSFSRGKQVRRERHRRFVETIVPLEVVSSGPGFAEYRLTE